MTMTVQRRMFIGLTSVVVVLVITVNFGVQFLLADIARREILNNLHHSVVAYRRFDDQRKELLVAQALSVAQTPYLKATLSIPDVDIETIRVAGDNLEDVSNSELLLIVGHRAGLAIDVHDAETIVEILRFRPGIRQAMDGELYSGVWNYDNSLYRVAVAPVVSNFQVVGVVVTGQQLDSAAAIRLVRDISGANVTWSHGGPGDVAAASPDTANSRYREPGTSALLTDSGELIQEVDGIPLAQLNIGGEQFFKATVPYPQVDAAMILHGKLDLTESGVGKMMITVLISSAIIMLLAAALCFRIASQISRPIVRLTQATTEFGKGDRVVRLEPESSDEIGQLTEAFNSMAKDIVVKRERLVTSRDAAEAANRAKSEFLARMSHEIRTPMNGVLGMTELLLSSSELDERQRDYANTIRRSGDSLLSIINDILDFSKIEAGKLELDTAPFDLRKTVEESVMLLAELAHQKGLELIADISPDLPCAVRGDTVRLRQILINLISNAVKFTERGEIVVRVRQIGEATKTRLFRFEVQDTGIGIKSNKQVSIFDSFTQEDGSNTRRVDGTGLGLSIAKDLAALMGGDIGVRSVQGQGSTFWFTSRLQCDEIDTTSLRPEPLAGLRALVVDDNATNRKILRHQLESWRMDVTDASSGILALERLSQATDRGEFFDILLSDVQMPEMDGLNLALAIRDSTANIDMKIVLLGSISGAFQSSAVQSAGISAHLTKPVRQADLYVCLSRTLIDATADIRQPIGVEMTGTYRRPSNLGAQILLVEDNPVNQQVARSMLGQLGCHVVVANNGHEAVAAFQREASDAILMDCQMPELDGYEATRRIRQLEHGENSRRTPIIALTANALSGDRERCIAAGMDDYLSKPFSLADVEDILSAHLSQMAERDSADNVSNGSSQLITDEQFIATTEADDSVLDRDALVTIRQLQQPNSPCLLSEIIRLYLDTSEQLLNDLRSAIDSDNASSMSAAAHTLKSSSANVGAMGLADYCKQLEAAGRAGKLNDASPLFAKLEMEYRRVVRALHIEMQDTAA